MMFSNQSPIGYGNGYTGGMGYPIPPNPIANVGGYGYNQPNYGGYNPYMNQQYQSQPMIGGYYTNNYYNTNPYLVQRQMELQRIQEEEAIKQQASIMKFISKNVSAYLGYEVNDEYLSQYDPYIKDPKEIQCEQHWERMQRLERLSQQQQNVTTQATRMNQNNNARMAMMKEKYPDDMSLFDFLEVAGELYCEAVAAKGLRQETQVNRLYNQNDFRQLLNLHNTGGSYYNSIMNFNPDDASIDDEEITLPENLARTYSERKAKFFNAILGG